MPRETYRYRFDETVSFADAVATLDLAMIAVQSLYGESRSRLDARFVSDEERRTIVIDGSTHVGQALNQVFVGYAGREFGKGAFRVERLDRTPAREPAGAAA